MHDRMKTKVIFWMLLSILGSASAQSTLSNMPITCLSGNCKEGKSKLRISAKEDRTYEGLVTQGVLQGECNIYDKAGLLIYTGTLKDFLPEGAGKSYAQNDQKVSYIHEVGTFANGRLLEGDIYTHNGEILARGKFQPQSPWGLINGWQSAYYRGKPCFTFCETKVTTASGLAEFDGKVIVREWKDPLDPETGRVLSEAYYVKGVRDGLSKEWDYENNIVHRLTFREGEVREDGLNAGGITDLATGKIVAMEVKYAPEIEKSLNFSEEIVSGTFIFEKGLLRLTARTEAPFTQFKSGYFEQASGNSAPIEQDQKAGMSEDMIMRMEAECSLKLERLIKIDHNPLVIRAKEFLNQINERPKSITTNMYNLRRQEIENERFPIVRKCDELIKEYKGIVSDKLMDQVFALRKAANEDLRFPTIEEIQARGGGK